MKRISLSILAIGVIYCQAQKAPKLDKWVEGLRAHISSNNCEEIKKYPWSYKTKVEIDPDDFEVADGEEAIAPNHTPNIGIFELRKGEYKFNDLWVENGIALAKCGEFVELLTDYDQLSKQADSRKGRTNQPNHIGIKRVEQHVEQKLWKGILKQLGEDKVYENFKKVLEDKSLDQKVRQTAADEILKILDIGWLELVDKKYAEILFPYFRATSSYVYYMDQTKHEPAIDKIIEALNSNSWKVRRQALVALVNFKAVKAKEKISKIADNDPYYEVVDQVKHYYVRDAAKEALTKLGQ